MTGTTRGRLPARVYWARRLMVLGTALLLVVGIARLLGGSSDGSSGPDRAAQVSDTSTKGSAAPSATTAHARHRHHHRSRSRASVSASPVAMPSGPCADNDVAITPSVPQPIAGSDITLVLDISTITSPACDWTLSGKSLALKITSGPDLIWTTVQCAKVIPTESLVLRNNVPTRVELTWNARRSEPGCPAVTDWAKLGTYHLHVAALAGQPQDVTFTLVAPLPPEVTKTVHPHRHRHHRHHKKHTTVID
ncbi:hypothetical protein [Nocardioides cynanchi]|uniref:hypothetical protein n=1 Tax=Nocardioides cynanchi TaxID=2558918 RepID=UPI0012464E27|nr:hypothetical protein [Nocardioides cynanchi]